MSELAAEVARHGSSEEIAWLGFRDGAGERTAAIELLEEYMLSVLLLDGVNLAVPDSADGGRWEGDEIVPDRLWGEVAASRVMGGRVEEAGEWLYLRLFLIERETGRLLEVAGSRLAGRRLREEVARVERREGRPQTEPEIELKLHLLAIREEGGITRPVEIQEKGTLQVGDRFQVRFRVSTDCQVYAFLFSSTGERREVFGSQLVYSGRWQYGPGLDTWLTLNETDQVYTLYLLAGRRLPEVRDELWERMGEMVDQRLVVRFAGLELVDRILVEFLLGEMETEETIQVWRGREGIAMAEVENFILEDGARLESRAELLRASPILVRAISFAVR